jgi:hypothetical protein
MNRNHGRADAHKSNIGGLLFPQQAKPLNNREPGKRNFHKENMAQMRQREREVQDNRSVHHSRSNSKDKLWKMKRFQSVGSKAPMGIKKHN